MESYFAAKNAKNHPDLDFNCKTSEFEAGLKLRRHLVERALEEEPIFRRARNTLNVAEANAKPLPDVINMTLAERKAAAKQKLFAGLKTCVSSSSGSNKGMFDSAVATGPNERALRAAVSVDVVRPELACFSKEATGTMPTSLRVDMHPLSEAASFKKMSAFCAASSVLTCSLERKPNYIFSLRVALRESTPPEEIAFLRSFIDEEVNGHGSGDREKLEFRVVTEEDAATKKQKKVAIVSFASYRQGDDVVGKFVSRLVDQMPFDAEASNLADVLRCATLHVQLPRDLAAVADSEEINWMALLEGARIASEVVLRDNLLLSGTAAAICGGLLGNEHKAKYIVAGIAAALLSKDTSVRVDVAPLELVFAQAVRDLGECARGVIAAWIKQRPPQQSDSEIVDTVKDTTAPHEGWASTLSYATAAGMTPMSLRRFLLGLAAGSGLRYNREGRERGFTTDWLIGMWRHVERVESFEILGPQTHVVVAAARGGITQELMAKVLPTSRQDLLDRVVKPCIVATHMRAEDDDDVVAAVERLSRNPFTRLDSSAFSERGWLSCGIQALARAGPKTSTSGTNGSSSSSNSNSKTSFFELMMTCSGWVSEPSWPRSGHPFMLFERFLPIGGEEKTLAGGRVKKVKSPWDFGGAGSSVDENGMARAASYDPELISGSGDLPADKRAFLSSCFAAHDYNGDGTLDRAELMSLCMTHFPQVAPTALHARIMARGTDGKLNFEEFVQVAKVYL